MPADLPIDSIIQGDCLSVLKTLPSESISAVVTDPPYGLGEVKDLPGLLMAWMQGADGKEHVSKGGLGRLLLLCPLDSRISNTMAGFAQGN